MLLESMIGTGTALSFMPKAGSGPFQDKVEIIVLGGTWSHYPRDYQETEAEELCGLSWNKQMYTG